jgi:predicted MPP superfamily phosphohydrolase
MFYVTRRRFLVGAGVGVAGTLSFGGYATAFETGSALTLAEYAPRLNGWPDDLELRIAVIADIHACYPWMSEQRIGEIVDLANAQRPDLTVLLGDFVGTHRFVSGYVPPGAWAEQLARLEAPLGVYSVLGNHDWWFAAIPTEPPDNSLSVRQALAAAQVPVLENQSLRLTQHGRPFWLIGLGDQIAHFRSSYPPGRGADDLWAAMREIRDEAPAILLVNAGSSSREGLERPSLRSGFCAPRKSSWSSSAASRRRRKSPSAARRAQPGQLAGRAQFSAPAKACRASRRRAWSAGRSESARK